MNVWGNIKKVVVGGSIAGAMVFMSSLTITGCLTKSDDKDTNTTVVDHSVKLTGEKTNDTVWNFEGPYHGAFNLVAGVTVGSSGPAADKDLQDLSSNTVLD